MKKQADKYFYEEMVGEGSLYIAFVYLRDHHGWTIEEYREKIKVSNEEGLCGFYVYGKDHEFISRSFDSIDFSDIENLKHISFDPDDKVWDIVNSFYE